MYVKVFVTADARRERVEETPRGILSISVKEPAAGNRANARVRALLAGRFGVPLAKVRIFAGHRSRSKILSITP